MTIDRPPSPLTDEATVNESAGAVTSDAKRVIGLLLVASFVVILNETIMGVALPNLMVELDITAGTAQWLTSAFLLTMAVVIPTTGFILQRFSTRALFISAMSLFTCGTLLAAVSPGFTILVTGRVVQAMGTALMLPLLITTVMTFVPAARRGQTIGLITIAIAVAPAIGPTFSGLILPWLNWRLLFFSVLPIGIISLVLGAVLVKNSTEPRSIKLDLLSVLLSTAAFGGLIYGLSSLGAAAEGHTPVRPLYPIVTGAVSLPLFAVRQIRLQKNEAALLDLRPFKSRSFMVAIAVLLVCMSALFGSLILLPIYLQSILGMTVLQTGLILLPGGLIMGLIAPLVGCLSDRFGPRPLVIPGMFVVASVLALMTLLDAATKPRMVVTIHVLIALGLSFTITPMMTSALGSLDAPLYSHGSAIINTLQQFAGAAGTALFITVMTRRSASDTAVGIDAASAQSNGIHSAFMWGAGLALIAAGISFAVRRPVQSPPPAAGLH